MKKVLNIVLVVLTLITSINPIYAYNKGDHDRDQEIVLNENRLIYEINDYAKVGDYVKLNRETIRMYYDKCGYNFMDCLGAFFMNVYDLNYYENREIVVAEAIEDKKETVVNVAATYKDMPIKEKVKVYGKYFEINFFQVTFYAVLGYDIKINDVVETKKVFDLFKFKFVTKQVTVKEYYAAKVTTKEVIVGYKKVIDVPAHTKKVKVPYMISPITKKYKAFLSNQSFGVGGYAYAAGEGLKSTLNFGGEIITAFRYLDADKITFIKDGREYFATVIQRAESASDVYTLLISDTYKTVTTSITVAAKYYTRNPDQISELMGTISYAIAIGKFADIGLSKLNSSIPVKINIDDDVIRLYSKFNDKLISPLIKYGDELVEITSKYGDDVINVIDGYDQSVVKSIWLRADDLSDLKYRLADIANDGSSKYIYKIADKIYDSNDKNWLAGIWDKSPFARGDIIDIILGNNTHHNFPGIDWFDAETRIAISNKSIDPRLKSYLNPSGFKSKLIEHVDDLVNFKGGKFGGDTVEEIAIKAQDIDAKVLKLAIPDSQLSLGQKNALEEVMSYAKNKGIQLKVVIVK